MLDNFPLMVHIPLTRRMFQTRIQMLWIWEAFGRLLSYVVEAPYVGILTLP